MKVSVVVSTEFEMDIDDKFKVMDLPECDDRWDEIPTELAQELVATVRQQILTGIYSGIHDPDISEIYNPDGEVLYRMGDWTLTP